MVNAIAAQIQFVHRCNILWEIIGNIIIDSKFAGDCSRAGVYRKRNTTNQWVAEEWASGVFAMVSGYPL